MRNKDEPNLCPVCGYPDLEMPAYFRGLASFQICPCCGVQFGYQDCGYPHAALREDWVAGGMPWHSSNRKPPRAWDPLEQLRAANLTT